MSKRLIIKRTGRLTRCVRCDSVGARANVRTARTKWGYQDLCGGCARAERRAADLTARTEAFLKSEAAKC